MNKLLFWCMISIQVVFSQSWNYLLCLTKHTICTLTIFEWLDGPWPDIKALFMYCHNFHVVLSDGDFFFAWSSMSCAWVISHMMTMSPNLISLFHRDLCYVLGNVCFYSDVSRWVTCYVVTSPLWHVVIRSLVDYSFVLRNFYFDWKIPCTVYVLWLEYSQLTVVVIKYAHTRYSVQVCVDMSHTHTQVCAPTDVFTLTYNIHLKTPHTLQKI